ncbi:unnamed protein product [Clonostachys rhizophaga]|uniref:Uncharacterized protein n=1 Tax=Clonostachys rhizophaga TaxID=160324 RepID=A0A9N9VJF8_9HYPO|nr:unnamed protein product [Clonostachys rhizophaga]
MSSRLAAALVETAGSAAAREAAVQLTSAKGQLRLVGAGERLGGLSKALGDAALVEVERGATHGLGDDDAVASAHLHWGLLLGRAGGGAACGGGHDDEAFGDEAGLRGSFGLP